MKRLNLDVYLHGICEQMPDGAKSSYHGFSCVKSLHIDDSGLTITLNHRRDNDPNSDVVRNYSVHEIINGEINLKNIEFND